MPDRFTNWGSLDHADRTLAELAPELLGLWNGGEYRMRHGDVKRLRDTLKRVKASTRALEEVLSLYATIAPSATETYTLTLPARGFIATHLASLEARGIRTV